MVWSEFRWDFFFSFEGGEKGLDFGQKGVLDDRLWLRVMLPSVYQKKMVSYNRDGISC